MNSWKGLWANVKIEEYEPTTFNSALISAIKSSGDVNNFILEQVKDIVEDAYNTPMTVILGELNGVDYSNYVDPKAGRVCIDAIIKLKEFLR